MSLEDRFFSSSKKRLGRGLDSLFSPDSELSKTVAPNPTSTTAEKEASRNSKSLDTLGIEQLSPNPHQPRKVFDKTFLKELADSIRENGLIQPVIVRKVKKEDGGEGRSEGGKRSKGSKYEIIAGERRWRAAAEAGLQEIPVRVLESDSAILPLVENIQRQDLNPLELAQAYQTLLKQKEGEEGEGGGLTQEKLAEKLGIPRATLANQLRILNLSSGVQELILQGKINFAVAKLLLQEKNLTQQLKWARHFAINNTGWREAQKLLSQKKTKKARGFLEPPHKQWQTQALNKIMQVYGVKADLYSKKKGGELRLRFFSNEELHRLMSLLLSSKD